MKKNILIVVSVAVVVVAIAALIMFLKPSDTTADGGANATGDASATVTASDSPTDEGSANAGAGEADAGEENPAVADDGTDYNALVYGENSNADGEAPKYANTKSNMNIKPVDPETDPANQLVDSSKVEPLKEEAKPDSN